MSFIERRRNRRKPAVANQARLEWADGRDFVDTMATLLDISQGGARFVSDSPPPRGRAVWLRLESPAETGWVSAFVARLDGPNAGALRFSSYCPHDLIDTLTSPHAAHALHHAPDPHLMRQAVEARCADKSV